MNERLKRSIRNREDEFITFAEQAIRKGMPFEQAVKSAPSFDTQDCKDRYNAWLKDAMQSKKWTGLDSVREETRKRRAAEDAKETDDKFYQSNRFTLCSHAEAGHSFEETGLPSMLKPLYQRAQREVLGFIPESDSREQLKQDAFLSGFADDVYSLKRG